MISPDVFFFLKIVSAIQDLLWFHTNFRIISSSSVKYQAVLFKRAKMVKTTFRKTHPCLTSSSNYQAFYLLPSITKLLQKPAVYAFLIASTHCSTHSDLVWLLPLLLLETVTTSIPPNQMDVFFSISSSSSIKFRSLKQEFIFLSRGSVD